MPLEIEGGRRFYCYVGLREILAVLLFQCAVLGLTGTGLLQYFFNFEEEISCSTFSHNNNKTLSTLYSVLTRHKCSWNKSDHFYDFMDYIFFKFQ